MKDEIKKKKAGWQSCSYDNRLLLCNYSMVRGIIL